ncbi:MAG: hypothetical protein ACRYGC_17435 [Janthinobacterium lividum]
MQIVATLDDPSGLGGFLDKALLADLQQAANAWAPHLAGQGTLTVDLQFAALPSGVLADGAPDSGVDSGRVLDGRTLVTPSTLYEMQTGTHLPSTQKSQGGSGSDMDIRVSTAVLSQLYTGLDGKVPGTEYDAVSLFEHEIDHGLGESGDISGTGARGGSETMYDHYVTIGADGSAVFTGPAATLVNGGDVVLTTLDNGENYYHLANSSSDPNANDLMSGLGLPPGVSRGISRLDVAILADSGVRVTDRFAGQAQGTTVLAPGQRFTGSGGTDFVVAQGSGTVTGAAAGTVDVFGRGGTLVFVGGGGTALVVDQGASALVLFGGGAGSALTAFAGGADVTYRGGAGADEIVNGAGGFTGTGGSGGSLTMFGGSGRLQFSGGGERDLIVDGAGAATVAAGVGAVFAGSAGGSVLSANGAGTFLAGQSDGDRLSASAAGGDILAAGAGNETLAGAGAAEIDIDFGGSGSDQVLLGHGDDSFVGGSGAATVQAGSGNETFFLGQGGPTLLDFAAGLTGGSETVSGFVAGKDRIHLSGYGGSPTFVAGSGGAVLGLSDGTTIALRGVTADGIASLLS